MMTLPPPPVPADAALLSVARGGTVCLELDTSLWADPARIIGPVFLCPRFGAEPDIQIGESRAVAGSPEPVRTGPVHNRCQLPAIVFGLTAGHEAPSNAFVEAVMPKRTQATNPPAPVPQRLAAAIDNLHAVVDVMMVLRDRDQLGTIAEIVADQIARRMGAVERAMKGRR